MQRILSKWLGEPPTGAVIGRETGAGLATFLTMSYIIFVQPAVLSGAMFNMETGLDFGAVTTATCLSAALASAIMGIYARYPIALSLTMIPYILVFLFMDVFDTLGTLIGVAEQAGFVKDNHLPRARQVMFSDAVGTVTGAALGTSTVTSFIESAAGVEQGGRTGHRGQLGIVYP